MIPECINLTIPITQISEIARAILVFAFIICLIVASSLYWFVAIDTKSFEAYILAIFITTMCVLMIAMVINLAYPDQVKEILDTILPCINITWV